MTIWVTVKQGIPYLGTKATFGEDILSHLTNGSIMLVWCNCMIFDGVIYPGQEANRVSHFQFFMSQSNARKYMVSSEIEKWHCSLLIGLCCKCHKPPRLSFMMPLTLWLFTFMWSFNKCFMLRHFCFFFRESASKVNTKVQQGLFMFAVSNSCMDPIVYGMFSNRVKAYYIHLFFFLHSVL